MIMKSYHEHISTDQIVLFPFDDFAFPFQNGVRLNLVPINSPRDISKLPIKLGPPGAPDCRSIYSACSVRRVGDEYWMWYHGCGDYLDNWHPYVCLAKSRDGLNWEKPNLELVEYRGSRNNNIVDMPGEDRDITHLCVVFYEPEDPDPARRFKGVIAWNKRLAAVISADGLHWREIEGQPQLPACEVSGGTKFNGNYFLSGHGGSHFGAPRQLVVSMSHDFEHWMEATCLGFRRENITPRPMVAGFNEGEQVHGGAALWNRGNVVIGMYGMWHGPVNNDRRHIDMDLGLVVSNDALHYREPVPDFRIVSAAEDGFGHLPEPMNFKHSGLVQGQGFENIGDETLFWYAPWPEQIADGIRVARWKRDRLGYFYADTEARQLRSPEACHVITAPISMNGEKARISLNIEGISEYAQVTVELLDERFLPFDEYTRDDCVQIDSGLKQAVTWKNHNIVEHMDGQFYIRVNFSGIRPEDPKLYALYVETGQNADTTGL